MNLSDFELATTAQVEACALQDRVDTKFVLRAEEMDTLLSILVTDFAVVQSEESLVGQYRNQYFDTDEYRFLREHHRGRRPRFKVRIRHYLDRNMSALEIKEKAPNGRTVKIRQPLAFMSNELSEQQRAFLDAHPRITAGALKPSVQVDFSRATLVSKQVDERLTIDTALVFSHEEEEEALGTVVVAEIKQPRFSPRSPGMLALRQSGATQLRISKYMTAGQLLLPSIRLPRYTPRLKMLRRRTA